MVRKQRLPDSCIIFLLIPVAMVGVMMISYISFLYDNRIAENEANRLIPEYVQQTYPELELAVSKARLSPKDSSYYAMASSTASPDTHFNVRWSRPGAIYDDYQDKVLDGLNTLDRLGREMTSEIEPLLNRLFGDQVQGRYVVIMGREAVEIRPPLDTPFSRDLKLPAKIYLTFTVADPTLECAAVMLQQTDALLKGEGYLVRSYRMTLGNEKHSGYDISIDADKIGDELIEILKDNLDSDGFDKRLYVSTYHWDSEAWEQEMRRKRLVVIILVAIPALAAIFGFLARSAWLEMKSHQARPAEIERADAIVVLGAAVWPGERPSPALARRTAEAVKLYQAGHAPLIIFTGGVGTYPPSEGRVAARYAEELGVPAEAIRFEEQSTSTWANAQGSWAISQGAGVKSAIVVSDGFHLARAKRIFTDVGFEQVQVVPVPESPFTDEQWDGFELRETLALIAYRLGIKTL